MIYPKKQMTLKDYEDVLDSIKELKANPYCDHLMFMNLLHREREINLKIEQLKAD